MTKPTIRSGDACNHFWRAISETQSQCAKCGECWGPTKQAAHERQQAEQRARKGRTS